jgi:hypothetical protein
VSPGSAALVGIGVPARPAAWEALGLGVVDGAIPFPNGALLLGHDGWVIAGPAAATEIEGVPLSTGLPIEPIEHPCGAIELDHVVLLTTSLERTSHAVADALGIERRRIRETDTVRQAFHRFDDANGVRGCIVEVVETDRVDATTVMGVVINVCDLHDFAGELGPDVLSPPKQAVQPGRFISSVRRDVGLGTAVAFMSPAR